MSQHFGRRPALLLNCIGGDWNILGMNQSETDAGVQIQPAVFVQEGRNILGRLFILCMNPEISVDAPNPWCDFQLHIDPLGPILEVPKAKRVAGVVSPDEFNQFSVLQQTAFCARQSTSKCACSLCTIVAHVPVAARVQPEPAKTVRHVGPFDHGLFNDIVHGSRSMGELGQPVANVVGHGSDMARNPPGWKPDMAAVRWLP